MESGLTALKGIAEACGLSKKETDEILAQLQAARLPKQCGTNERVAALVVANFFR
ncbi:MAG: hypothetical protein WCF77_01715 [Minisyncoccia bacterium]|jgi:DNA-binding IclR family transcriptional regulator